MPSDARPDDVSCPACGHDLTWDEWLLHWHNPNRLDDARKPSLARRVQWKAWRIRDGLLRLLSVVIGLLWSLISSLAVIAVVAILLLTIYLGFYHWNKGASVESALALTLQDYQAAVACPKKADRLLAFVQRPALKPEVVGTLGDDWTSRNCEGVDLAELLLESDSEAASPAPTAAAREGGGLLAPNFTRPEPTVQVSQPVSIALKSQLPRNVYEEFESSFYESCPRPIRERLSVTGSWSGRGDEEVRFLPPDDTYYLVVVGEPEMASWHFDSVLDSGNGRFESLTISSDAHEHLTDAQQWCSSGFGVSTRDTLEIDSSGVSWTVYLIEPVNEEPLTEMLRGSLDGYYDLCPELPPIDSLAARVLGSGEGDATLDFRGTPPHYFLGVLFEPAIQGWSFGSVDVRGDWRSLGPAVSHESGDTIGFSAICPTSASSHHLEVVSRGGRWTVYLITTSRE